MLVEVVKMGKVERATCTSLDVAETFEKEHKYVLRDIREMKCSEEFRVSNFGLSKYVNSQGREQPMFIKCAAGYPRLYRRGWLTSKNNTRKQLIA